MDDSNDVVDAGPIRESTMWREALNKVLVAHGVKPGDVLMRSVELDGRTFTYREIQRYADGSYKIEGGVVVTLPKQLKLTKADKETLGYE